MLCYLKHCISIEQLFTFHIQVYYFNINNKNNVNTSNSTNSTQNDNSKLATALNTVNIMSDRGKNFSIIGTLPQGTKVKVIDTKFDWHKIEYNGRYGYVSGVYVK